MCLPRKLSNSVFCLNLLSHLHDYTIFNANASRKTCFNLKQISMRLTNQDLDNYINVRTVFPPRKLSNSHFVSTCTIMTFSNANASPKTCFNLKFNLSARVDCCINVKTTFAVPLLEEQEYRRITRSI